MKALKKIVSFDLNTELRVSRSGTMKIKAIITGSTGMVGEGVLMESLLHPEVEKVLVINRRPCGIIHPKLTEILHNNFFDLSPITEQLKG